MLNITWLHYGVPATVLGVGLIGLIAIKFASVRFNRLSRTTRPGDATYRDHRIANVSGHQTLALSPRTLKILLDAHADSEGMQTTTAPEYVGKYGRFCPPKSTDRSWMTEPEPSANPSVTAVKARFLGLGKRA